MNNLRSISHRIRPSQGASRQWWALPAAFVATVLALPVNAGIEIPTDPLTSEKRLPPNIVFILDDSSSMGLVAMPAAVRDSGDGRSRYISGRTGLGDNPTDRSYVTNTIYYNPATTYRPWVKADGSRYNGGTTVDDVFASLDKADGSGGHGGKCGTFDPNQLKRCDLRDTASSYFYVPNVDKGYTKGSVNLSHYDKYNIRIIDGVTKMGIGDGTTTSAAWNDKDVNAGTMLNVGTITVPADSGPLVVTAKNGTGSNSNADLYIKFGGYPTVSSYDERDNAPGNTAAVTIDSPAAGTWYIALHNSGSGKLSKEDVAASVLKFREQTPTSRTQAQELENFATWYSYYRTRIKTAKGGASESFESLGKNYRIGYSAINSVDSTDDIIPIDSTSKGEFSGGNKAGFFTALQGAGSGSGQSTPLRQALKSVGNYFRRSDAKGPWGPGAGAEQFSCRQNFAILTTDGYWSSGNNGLGNEDGSAGSPYADGSSDTLADVAFKYWKDDLRSDMTDNVPTSADDGNNSKQHMNTFTVSIGVEGTLKASDLPALKAGTKSWPSLSNSNNAEIKEKIDDLWHAAINGRGDFVVANDPVEFTNALNAALATINGRTSSYSNVASSSVSLNTGAMVFNASYVSGSWSGTLTASAVSDAGVGGKVWDASFPTTRSIKTKADASNALVNFPTSDQIAALGGGAIGADVANYLKGDQSKEKGRGGAFRDRTVLLGDIVGSSPAYVEDTNTIFVGANDGMLHAFNAEDGKEIYAYVPTGLNWGDLASLSSPTYTHRFFVDGPIVVSSRSLTPGKNILVGALGKGGKGLYALDVTSPSSPAPAWELKDTTNGYMGLVMGKPLMVNLKDGPAVILGNGVNSSKDEAALIVIKLNADGTYKGQVEIPTGAAGSNGLSAPAAVYGKDGKTVSYVYAGDLLGNVWKFDLTPATPTVKQLFAAGSTQPISAGVTVATDQRTSKRWVFFGTGRYLIAGDASSTGASTQSMYGFIDDGIAAPLVPSDLVNNTPSAWTAGTVAGMSVRAFKAKAALPAGAKGWRVDMPTGERIVQDAQVVSTFLVTASMSPNDGTDPCKPDGSGYINALDAFTGTSAGGSYFNLDNNKSTNETIGGLPVGSVNLGNGMPTLPNLLRGLLVVGGTGGGGLSSPQTLTPRWDRVSWREVRSD